MVAGPARPPGQHPREGFGAGIWSSFFLCYQFPSRPPARRSDRGAGSTLRRPRVGGGRQARMALCHPAAFSHLHPIPKPPGEGRATSQVGRGCGEHPRSSQEPPTQLLIQTPRGPGRSGACLGNQAWKRDLLPVLEPSQTLTAPTPRCSLSSLTSAELSTGAGPYFRHRLTAEFQLGYFLAVCP